MLTAFSNRCHVSEMKRKAIPRCLFPDHPVGVCFVALAMLLSACDRSPQPEATANNSTNRESVGQKIQFSQNGNSEQYRVSGWSHTETDFTWTEGSSAKLEVPVASGAGPWTLKVSMSGLIRPPELPSQLVEVYANDQKIAEWQVGSVSEFRATIPASASKPGGTMSIEFRIPKATSPQALGVNTDPRVLGVCVRWLELAKTG